MKPEPTTGYPSSSTTNCRSQMRTPRTTPIPGFKGNLLLLSFFNNTLLSIAPNAPHPDRCHTRWGKPRRKNAYNGLRSNDHHILQFSATQAPEDDLITKINRDKGILPKTFYSSLIYFILELVDRDSMLEERENLILEGVQPPTIPSSRHYDQMSSFSCQTGRYTSTAGDVIVFRAGQDDDTSTIKTEVDPPSNQNMMVIEEDRGQSTLYQKHFGGSYAQSSSTCTGNTPSRIETDPSSDGETNDWTETNTNTTTDDFGSHASTPTTGPALTGAATIPVNAGHDDNHYDILLRQKDQRPKPNNTNRRVQTSK